MRYRAFFLTCFFALACCIVVSRAQTASIDYRGPEDQCLKSGWRKAVISVKGVRRDILWKGPGGAWVNGTIIALHGGGGSSTNWCSEMKVVQPSKEFADQAVRKGFGVFALDSSDRLFKDTTGNTCGKRFACVVQDDTPNPDLDFIETVLTTVIPGLRPEGSAKDIYMTGVSNGGFMTILAATSFDAGVTAFAPVSAGDPYGTYIDCRPNLTPRQGAPGLFYDRDTGKTIGEDDSCIPGMPRNEKEWKSQNPVQKPWFKQFHNEGDAGVDISCMKKVRTQLLAHGYRDGGPFVLRAGSGKKLWKHFWLRGYNEPILAFFISHKKKIIPHSGTR